MGAEDLFKKQKEQRQAEKKRVVGVREQFQRILIVAEGEKTEPHYFLAMRNHYKISSLHITIPNERGSAPISVVRRGIQHYKNSSDNDPFDKVFCVFDRDSHKCFDAAKQQIAVKNKSLRKEVFHCIESTPSFEYWYLLHYKDTKRPYAKTQKKSVGDLVVEELKEIIPKYEKNKVDMFELTKDKLNIAMTRSERIWKVAIQNDEMNPSTNVHDLIKVFLKGARK